MPTKEAHLGAAAVNQQAIDHLCEKIDTLPGWVAVAAFYKAVHLVEALFDHDGRGHMHDHKERNNVLKRENRYKHIWQFYSPLWQISLVARYLEDEHCGDVPVFASYMPPDRVKSTALDHYLRKIESSARGLIEAS